MKRQLQETIAQDLKKKMIILTGPMQIGKTYLAKQLMADFQEPVYLNHDSVDDRQVILNRSWPWKTSLLVLDEIHKMKKWKSWLKGIVDTKEPGQSILVTGSARLATFRKSGQALPGRYFHIRLHPLSVRELAGQSAPQDALERLNQLGGFPEPFLDGTANFAGRWNNQYYQDLLREEINDLFRVHEIRSLELLLHLLRNRVGSPVSYNSLARDVQLSPHTVKQYIQIFEALYIVFLVHPYHRNISRSLLKEPKVYFYNTGFVRGSDGARLENTCAVSLLKHIHYCNDIMGMERKLHYLRTRNGQEVDFAIANAGNVEHILEVKLSSSDLSPHLVYFQQRLPSVQATQLVMNLQREEHRRNCDIRQVAPFLASLEA